MLETVIPVVRLEGVIAAGRGLGGRTLNLVGVEPALTRAFSIRKAPCVAIVVNSPGGSPVQSALIARRIRGLAEAKGKKAIVFIEDAAASGGYWLACAGDEVFADATSIVGSIGVIGGGFGFAEAMARLGVERRVHTAGRRKSQLDPFRPESPEDVARLDRLLRALHGEFVDWVRARREGRLKPHPDMFEGEVFTGREAVELGLVDALGDLNTVLRARFGERAKLRTIGSARPSLAQRLLGGAVEEIASELEMRAFWGRLNL
jgi:signal peptide peptidase SppA